MESDLESRYWNAQMKVLILQARSLKHFRRYLREALEMNILAREQSKHRLVGLCVQLLCIVVGFQGSSKKRRRREETRTTTHDEQVVLNKEQAVGASPEKRKHEGETEAKKKKKTPAEEEVAHKKEHDAQAPSDKSREEGEKQVNLT